MQTEIYLNYDPRRLIPARANRMKRVSLGVFLLLSHYVWSRDGLYISCHDIYDGVCFFGSCLSFLDMYSVGLLSLICSSSGKS
ncbi:hypothetical protein C8Q69DRAFT_19878 [Paecilomyces variotii]|uniref:Uncharacterized protein n=1 Tax=Byssochlamys spectabilis TaxID=264951 RepID=A0A443I5C3_BYSSP|nr:hypothetical protein C8Q69DRAFT_19878 [Paecilomyces variotii]RWQ99290.1 hypothetical protein C8Q69DRAFT_19878 [Paecilomyces variotii]